MYFIVLVRLYHSAISKAILTQISQLLESDFGLSDLLKRHLRHYDQSLKDFKAMVDLIQSFLSHQNAGRYWAYFSQK